MGFTEELAQLAQRKKTRPKPAQKVGDEWADEVMHIRSKYYRWSFAIDWLLLNLSFMLINFIKNGSIELSPTYLQLLFLFNVCWLIVALSINKFALNHNRTFKKGLFNLGKGIIFTFYLISFLVVFFELHIFSRMQIFGSGLLFLGLEIAFLPLTYRFVRPEVFYQIAADEPVFQSDFRISLAKTIADILIFFVSFYAVNYLKRESLVLTDPYESALLMAFALWFGASIITRKYSRRKFNNFFYAAAPYFKSFLIVSATAALIVFAFRLFFYSRGQIYGTFLLALGLELIFIFLYQIATSNILDTDIETLDEVKKALRQEDLEEAKATDDYIHRKLDKSVRNKLKNKYFADTKSLFSFIDDTIDLEEIDEGHTVILNTRTRYNIEILDQHVYSLLVNLHIVNDFRRINRYLLEIHSKIFNGGYFVGSVDTVNTYNKRFRVRYTPTLAKVLYPVYFFYKRIMPKLSGLEKLYFAISQGKGRIISKAEILGRLYFSGFKVLNVKEIDNRLYFIAQRVKTPSIDRNPSWGPIISLRRIGFGGKVIHVRKFRTMHPYSEYLQEYIYEHNKLQENGKFSDDFRITSWGKAFRRMWIDELPQIINYVQGDLNLVGVRALSQQYFELYPEDLKELRVQFKPGLVPPYYADMPEDFDEIVASERNYLMAKKKAPLTTDIKYFFKAFYNIVFKKARSR